MEIRNDSYSGESLYSFNPLLNSTGWVNITFTENIFLTPGKYFLWMQAIAPQYSSWEKSLFAENDTETWEYTGTWVLTDFDLSLKVITSELINPEDVELKVNNFPIEDTIQGEGKIKIEGAINSSITILTVSSNESISIFYSLESFFCRNRVIQYETQVQQERNEWNLTLNSSYLDYPYFDYRINISGIKEDYYDVQVYNQTDVIGYSSFSSEVIGFTTEATHIIFKSLNYIESVILDNNLQIGSITTINISAKGIGDIYAFIWDNETLVYQNSSYNVSNQNFHWYLDPSIDQNSLVVEIFFNGSNEIGYYSKAVSISRIPEIITSPIHGYTLDNFSFSCLYRDYYSQLPISDGIITYSFGELSGVMEMDIYGNYSNSIDLSQFGILPGEYSILLTAEKENYGLIYSEIPIVINPRIVLIELSKTRRVISPGNTIDFAINIKDIKDQSYLLRPVDLQIKIFNSGNHTNDDLVYYEKLEGINDKDEFSWNVPSDIEEGSYDIVIEVINEYYTGILILDDLIEVKSSNFWVVSLPLFFGLVSIFVAGYFVKKDKVKKSLLGLIILHDSGAPLAEKLSYIMQKSDASLISCAFTGILSLIKEITGFQLRTIEIEGGYVNLVHGNSFWLLIFLKDNPRWIKKGILKLKDEIQIEYGEKIQNFNGEVFEISIDDLIKKYFNTQLPTEHNDEERIARENFTYNIRSYE